MLKKEDTITSLSRTAELWVEINFDGIFRMEAKSERLLIAKALRELFHFLSNFLTYTDDVAESKKKQCKGTITDKLIQTPFVYYKTYLLQT